MCNFVSVSSLLSLLLGLGSVLTLGLWVGYCAPMKQQTSHGM